MCVPCFAGTVDMQSRIADRFECAKTADRSVALRLFRTPLEVQLGQRSNDNIPPFKHLRIYCSYY